MSELKLTNEKIKAYEDENGAFRTKSSLEHFGEKQNKVNELLAANINDLIKRVCSLEDTQVKNENAMKKIADDLNSFKAEIDRLKLTSKLNTNAIDRLNSALETAQGSDTADNK